MSKIKTSTYSFIAFDVVDFDPLITLDLLNAASDFASNYNNITDDERHIITHAKKSCFFSSGEQWCKKFDITMGSYDGSESMGSYDGSESSFLLHQITTKHGNNFGLYTEMTDLV